MLPTDRRRRSQSPPRRARNIAHSCTPPPAARYSTSAWSAPARRAPRTRRRPIPGEEIRAPRARRSARGFRRRRRPRPGAIPFGTSTADRDNRVRRVLEGTRCASVRNLLASRRFRGARARRRASSAPGGNRRTASAPAHISAAPADVVAAAQPRAHLLTEDCSSAAPSLQTCGGFVLAAFAFVVSRSLAVTIFAFVRLPRRASRASWSHGAASAATATASPRSERER